MSPKRYRNTGRPPRDNTIPLGIIWGNGREARQTYFANQLNWKMTDPNWRIAEYYRADGLGEKEEAA